MMLGTPFYDVDTDSWSDVDSVRQTEAECRARAFLAAVILALAQVPQCALSRKPQQVWQLSNKAL